MTKKIALVTGANRGLGFEVVKQLSALGHHVIAATREPQKLADKIALLLKEGRAISVLPLDVRNENQITAATETVLREFSRLDILINNAGIFLSDNQPTLYNVDKTHLMASLEVNTVAAFLLCQQWVPVMRKQGHGRIVNVSSLMGKISEFDESYPGYRLSKAALNLVTMAFAKEVEGTDVLINSLHPGWVKTDMGGKAAPLAIPEGGEALLQAATLPAGGPNGKFLRMRRDRLETLDW